MRGGKSRGLGNGGLFAGLWLICDLIGDAFISGSGAKIEGPTSCTVV